VSAPKDTRAEILAALDTLLADGERYAHKLANLAAALQLAGREYEAAQLATLREATREHLHRLRALATWLAHEEHVA
jgi:hypothetical protein